MNVKHNIIEIYRDQFGKEPYNIWIKALKDPYLYPHLKKTIDNQGFPETK